jgi:hypothetical protein
MEPGALKPEMTRDELGAALTGHTLGAPSVVTRYGQELDRRSVAPR